MLTQEEIERRVKRGSALMDRVHPGWHKKINLQDLNMDNSCRCVIGQIFGKFDKRTLARLGLDNKGKAAAFGFTFSLGDGPANLQEESQRFCTLERYWAIAVLGRRAADPATTTHQ